VLYSVFSYIYIYIYIYLTSLKNFKDSIFLGSIKKIMSFFFRYSQENDPSFLDVAKKMMPSLFSMVKKMPIFFKHGQENDFFFLWLVQGE